MNELPPKPSPSQARWMTLLAIGFGFLFAFLMWSNLGSKRSDGPVKFTYRQASVFGGTSAGVEFDLPAGWGIVYNGHQKWHGGTVVDAAGQPRMEVWLHDISTSIPVPDSEVVAFSWGKARYVIRKDDMDRPFNSFPRARGGRVVSRDYYLDRGLLSFRSREAEDAELKSIIASCMSGLRQQAGD